MLNQIKSSSQRLNQADFVRYTIRTVKFTLSLFVLSIKSGIVFFGVFIRIWISFVFNSIFHFLLAVLQWWLTITIGCDTWTICLGRPARMNSDRQKIWKTLAAVNTSMRTRTSVDDYDDVDFRLYYRMDKPTFWVIHGLVRILFEFHLFSFWFSFVIYCSAVRQFPATKHKEKSINNSFTFTQITDISLITHFLFRFDSAKRNRKTRNKSHARVCWQKYQLAWFNFCQSAVKTV